MDETADGREGGERKMGGRRGGKRKKRQKKKRFVVEQQQVYLGGREGKKLPTTAKGRVAEGLCGPSIRVVPPITK